MRFHKGERFQSGRGIGALFSGFFRTLKPLLSTGFNIGKKIITSDAAKKIGSEALDILKPAAKNLAVDLLEGKDMGESLNKELAGAKAKIAAKIQGSGRRRKRKLTADTDDEPTLKKILRGRSKFNLLN
jgi:hypothetical protein